LKLHNRILLETVQSFPSGNYATIKCVLYGQNRTVYHTGRAKENGRAEALPKIKS